MKNPDHFATQDLVSMIHMWKFDLDIMISYFPKFLLLETFFK